MKVLLLSNSTMPGTPFFTWPRPYVSQFLGDSPGKLVFIPFAAVTFSFDAYESAVKAAFGEMNYSIESLHHSKNPVSVIEKSDGIVVGGGNSFALLNQLSRPDLLEVIREKVKSGTPYLGWSAGANLACPTIMTTNDMPIVQPPSLNALELVPFQINPHYHELRFENQGGETRKERLAEFLVMNPTKKIIGLPEGMFLKRDDDNLIIGGKGEARLFEAGKAVIDLPSGTELNHLL